MTTYSLPPRVAYVAPEPAGAPHVFVMRLPDGPPVALEGTAALIWLAAIEGVGDVAGDVSALVGAVRAEIADDVEAYLGRLVEMGLLNTATN